MRLLDRSMKKSYASRIFSVHVLSSHLTAMVNRTRQTEERREADEARAALFLEYRNLKVVPAG